MTQYVIALLDKHHQRKTFECGQEDLNNFIQLYALQQQKRQQNKTYVAYTPEQQIIGFYSLNVGAIAFEEMPAEIQKRLARYPIPTVYIGRFAVDVSYQGKGLGKVLLSHALHRVCEIAAIAGVTVVAVDAKNQQAAHFYQTMGFRALPSQPLKLFLPVTELLKVL